MCNSNSFTTMRADDVAARATEKLAAIEQERNDIWSEDIAYVLKARQRWISWFGWLLPWLRPLSQQEAQLMVIEEANREYRSPRAVSYESCTEDTCIALRKLAQASSNRLVTISFSDLRAIS